MKKLFLIILFLSTQCLAEGTTYKIDNKYQPINPSTNTIQYNTPYLRDEEDKLVPINPNTNTRDWNGVYYKKEDNKLVPYNPQTNTRVWN